MPDIFILNNILRTLHKGATSFCQKRWIQTSVKRLAAQQMIKRPPVVTIMGHVDHGKTTLLDNLRNSHIVKQEFGGITQHIGAFVVPFKKNELVTFLDTPGHAAFAAMRQRGANVTDIVVLVVACDDGVLDQTIESINYAKDSRVPIIVAINKIDKYPDERELKKNIALVRKQLVVHDIMAEQDGGEVQLVNISALKGIGVEDLKEAILALAETLELKAQVDGPVCGRIIESQVHMHRGKLCTVLVQNGTLKKNDILLAGSYNYAKVRALFDERGQLKQTCGPGLPIQVTGWREDEIPAPGDSIRQVENEVEAKKIIANYNRERVQQKALEDSKVAAERATEHQQMYHEKLVEKRESGFRFGRIFFTERGVRPKLNIEDEMKDRKINLVLKCDVDGSLEAILDLLDSYDKDNKQLVKLDVMHYGVGAINDNDLVLASSFPNSIIYGFNVKFANQKILANAKQAGVTLKLFNVIYHLIDDLKARISEKQPELEQEIEQGRAKVIQEFIVKELKKKTRVAGCLCNRGLLKVDNLYKLLRNNEVIVQDLQVKTLKHLKENVREIEKDKECGISFLDKLEKNGEPSKPFQFLPGDILIAYERRKYKPKLKWDLKGFN